jgi:hypothetical protein
LGRARFVAIRARDQANQRQLVQGFTNYATDNKQTLLPSIVEIWGDAPGYAYCAYGGSPVLCDLMPIINGYNLATLTPNPMTPLSAGIGHASNTYPPPIATPWVVLSGYFYFPGYNMTLVPQSLEASAPTRIDKALPEHVMFQDYSSYLPTLLPPGQPYYTVQPDGPNGSVTTDAPVGLYAGCFDGSVRWRAGSTLRLAMYYAGAGGYYVVHTQP